MKIVPFDTDQTEINIVLFGDLHIGSSKFNYNLIKERVAQVKDSPNTYAIILGDMINNSTKDSVGDTYTDTLSPMNQIKVAARIFEPIKDKIIAVTSGNHERRSYKKEGVDLMYFLAAELGVADKYDYAACLLWVTQPRNTSSVGKANNVITTTIYLTHGDGNGGRTIGGKANGMSRRGDIVNADVIVTGHTHTPIVFKEASFEVDKSHKKVFKHEQLFVNCGATLNYEEYAELYGMAPSSTSNPEIKIVCGMPTAHL